MNQEVRKRSLQCWRMWIILSPLIAREYGFFPEHHDRDSLTEPFTTGIETSSTPSSLLGMTLPNLAFKSNGISYYLRTSQPQLAVFSQNQQSVRAMKYLSDSQAWLRDGQPSTFVRLCDQPTVFLPWPVWNIRQGRPSLKDNILVTLLPLLLASIY